MSPLPRPSRQVGSPSRQSRRCGSYRFSPAVAFYAAERTWHPTQTITRHKDGSLTLAFTASGRIEIERWIRGWGEECEVVSMRDAQGASAT